MLDHNSREFLSIFNTETGSARARTIISETDRDGYQHEAGSCAVSSCFPNLVGPGCVRTHVIIQTVDHDPFLLVRSFVRSWLRMCFPFAVVVSSPVLFASSRITRFDIVKRCPSTTMKKRRRIITTKTPLEAYILIVRNRAKREKEKETRASLLHIISPLESSLALSR